MNNNIIKMIFKNNCFQLILLNIFIFFLYKTIYFNDIPFVDIGRIMLLDINYTEELVFERFNLYIIGYYSLILSLLIFYLDISFTKINNIYYLSRFQNKKKYIFYIVKDITLRSFIYIFIWYVIVISLSLSSNIYIIILSFIKMLCFFIAVQFTYYNIIMYTHKKNPLFSLIILFVMMLFDVFIKTSFLSMNESIGVVFIYLCIAIIWILIVSLGIILQYKKNEMEEIV